MNAEDAPSTDEPPPDRATPESGARSPFQVLRIPNYRRFVSAVLFTSIALWTGRIAQDWLVLELTDSPTLVGATVALQFFPTLLFGMLGGLIADRYPKRKILQVTQSTFLLLLLALAVLTLTDLVAAWQVMVVAFCSGVVFSIDLPTRSSLVAELVETPRLRNAISMMSATFELGALIGPAVSGVLIHVAGSGYTFLIAAAVYLGPIIGFSRMNPSELHLAPRIAREKPLTQLVEGLRYVAERPDIKWMLILMGTFGLVAPNLPVTNAAFAKLVFDNGSTGYGWLSSTVAVGSISGALLVASRRAPPRIRSNLSYGLGLMGLYVLASFMPTFYSYLVVLALIGALQVTFLTSCNSMIQLAAGPHLRGRVMGLYMLVYVGGGAIGGPIVGAMDEYLGPRTGLLISGLVPAAATVLIGFMLGRALRIRVRVRPARQLDQLVTVIPRGPSINPALNPPLTPALNSVLNPAGGDSA